MKVFCASLVHESNSFSPIPTNLESYQASLLYRPSTREDAAHLRTAVPECCLRLCALAAGHQVIDGLYAATSPSMPTNRRDYELLRDELLASLEAALPVDCVLLFLHGAQIAEDYPDCEGDVLARIRALVGHDFPIGVELDLHANISQAMVNNATSIIACKEYPHTDFMECASNLLTIMENTVAGIYKPVMTLQRVPMFGFFHTTREPMRSFIDKIKAIENTDDVLAISLAHGFAYGDCSDAGASVIVVTDNNPSKGAEIVAAISQKFFSLREAIKAPTVSVESAIKTALAYPVKPVIIADTTDNPGGGAAGDSTFILHTLLERGIKNAALAMIWDPEAVKVAQKTGVGGTFPLRLGGKTGPMSGTPLDTIAKVIALNANGRQMAFGAPTPLGAAASLQIEGVTVIVNSIREQVHDPACFTELGIDPTNMDLLVVKSAQHFYERFAPLAQKIIYADPPGTIGSDFAAQRHNHITRPVWPIDEAPFDAFGKYWH